MWSLKYLALQAIVLVVCQRLVESERDWYYDFISFRQENYTPDICVMDLKLERISRGIFAVSGTVDIKQNITDTSIWNLTTYYSVNGQFYTKAPFFVLDTNLSQGVNEYYKPILMNDLNACGENVPVFEDSFVPPFMPRLVTLRNCTISPENLPSTVREGFYKIIFEAKGEAKGLVETVVQVIKN